VPEPVDIASLVQSKLNDIIPELTKKVAEEVTSNIRKSEIKSDIPSEQFRKSESEVVHDGVTCDGCGKYPIVGHRYKCVICHNFDFCEACEAKGDHPHAFLKIRNPAQAPKVLIASMDDANSEGLEINGKFMDTGMIQNLIRHVAPHIPHCLRKFAGCFNKIPPCEKPSEEKKEKPKDEEPLKSESVPFFVPDNIADHPVEKKVEEPLKLNVPKKEECPVAAEK